MMNEDSARLVEVVKQLVVAMNATEQSQKWEFKPLDEPYPTQYIRMVGNPECELAIRIETYGASKGRIEIHGNYHLETGKQADHSKREFFDVREYDSRIGVRRDLPKITIAGTKTPEQMANDIYRRFLPEYTLLFQKAVAQRDAQRDYRTKQLATMRELAPLVHADLSRAIAEDRDRFTFSHSGAYGEVSVYSDTANLNLSSVPPEKAKRILAIMGE